MLVEIKSLTDLTGDKRREIYRLLADSAVPRFEGLRIRRGKVGGSEAAVIETMREYEISGNYSDINTIARMVRVRGEGQ